METFITVLKNFTFKSNINFQLFFQLISNYKIINYRKLITSHIKYLYLFEIIYIYNLYI